MEKIQQDNIHDYLLRNFSTLTCHFNSLEITLFTHLLVNLDKEMSQDECALSRITSYDITTSPSKCLIYAEIFLFHSI